MTLDFSTKNRNIIWYLPLKILEISRSAINGSHQYPLIIFLYSKLKIDNMPPCYKKIHLRFKIFYKMFELKNRSQSRNFYPEQILKVSKVLMNSFNRIKKF